MSKGQSLNNNPKEEHDKLTPHCRGGADRAPTIEERFPRVEQLSTLPCWTKIDHTQLRHESVLEPQIRNVYKSQ